MHKSLEMEEYLVKANLRVPFEHRKGTRDGYFEFVYSYRAHFWGFVVKHRGEDDFFIRLLRAHRIYRGGFTDYTREEISALGSLPLWGNSKFHFRVRSVPSLPGVDPKPPLSPILDSTGPTCASLSSIDLSSSSNHGTNPSSVK